MFKELDNVLEFGEEFCALHCIDSIAELNDRREEFFDYVDERRRTSEQKKEEA